MTWTGNPLTKEGTRLSLVYVSGELRKVEMRGRDWVLDVLKNRANADPWQLDCLLSVVLRGLMPEAAKREAERLLGWAEVYYGITEEA